MPLTGKDVLVFIRKQPIGFACGVVGAACLLLYYFHLDRVDEQDRLNEQKAGEAAKILTNVKNSANLNEQMAAVQKAVKELESRLINPGALAVNLQYFYKLETETGVKLVDVRPGTPAAPAKGSAKPLFSEVPFTVAVQGNFNQVLAFLRHLENGSPFCRFKNIEFNLTKAAGATEADTSPPELISLTLSLELLGQP